MDKTLIGVFLRGVCMGIADIIPGVSGGTVAFIGGIYGRLLAALAAFTRRELWMSLARLQIAAAWRRVDGGFLFCLLAGILCAVAVFSRLLKYLLVEHAHLLLAFFCGLIVASAVVVALELRAPAKRHWFFFAAGFFAALVAVTVAPTVLPPTKFNFFIGGAIAICAMLLPGISGSYILLILGLYGELINALHDFNFSLVAVFAAGCAGGILSFARLMAFALNRAHDAVVSFLIGVMLGALPKLWPWKESADGLKIILQKNVSPAQFFADPQIAAVVFLAAAGALVVVIVRALRRRQF